MKTYWVRGEKTFQWGCFVEAAGDTQAGIKAQEKVDAAVKNLSPGSVATEEHNIVGVAVEAEVGIPSP